MIPIGNHPCMHYFTSSNRQQFHSMSTIDSSENTLLGWWCTLCCFGRILGVCVCMEEKIMWQLWHQRTRKELHCSRLLHLGSLYVVLLYSSCLRCRSLRPSGANSSGVLFTVSHFGVRILSSWLYSKQSRLFQPNTSCGSCQHSFCLSWIFILQYTLLVLYT